LAFLDRAFLGYCVDQRGKVIWRGMKRDIWVTMVMIYTLHLIQVHFGDQLKNGAIGEKYCTNLSQISEKYCKVDTALEYICMVKMPRFPQETEN
jgi:hypothetical protein